MVRCAVIVLVFTAAVTADDLPEAERAKMAAEAKSQNKAGIQLFQQKKYAEALEPFRRALGLHEKLHADAHVDVAAVSYNLGDALRLAGKPVEALPHLERALAMFRKLYPDGHVDLARCIARAGSARHALGQYDRALPLLREALEARKKLLPEEHSDRLSSLNNLSAVLVAMGRHAEALPLLEEGLAAKKKLYPAAQFPNGHESLAVGLHNVAAARMALGRQLEALPELERALAMYRRLYPLDQFPEGARPLAFALQSMGNLWQELNRPDKAMPFAEQALAMHRSLYPPSKYPAGHPDYARSHNALSGLWRVLGQFDKALSHAEQALALWEKLYPPDKFPDGHPDLAAGYNRVGAMLQLTDRVEKALPYHERSLAMFEQVFPASKYPNGHRRLTLALSNLAQALAAADQLKEALPVMERALAACEKQHPQGSHSVAATLGNLAVLLHKLGRNEDAIQRLDSCIAMRRKHSPADDYDLTNSVVNAGVLRVLMGRFDDARPLLEVGLAGTVVYVGRTASLLTDADALELTSAMAQGRDALLIATRTDDDPTRAYRSIWPSKALLTRMLQARQAALRAARHSSAEVRAQADELFLIRTQMAQALHDQAANRDEYFQRLAARRDQLERSLAEAIPGGEGGPALDAASPADLSSTIPPGAVFVDFIRYNGIDEKGEHRSAYAAFVVAKGQRVRRVDLMDAAAIDAGITEWRKAIATGSTSEAAEGRKLRGLVWDPIARLLPDRTEIVYLAPDGDLARLPWAALPGRDAGSVLLAELTLAMTPHGSFLLEQLKSPMAIAKGPESVLLLGGLLYDPPGPSPGKGAYPFLKGSLDELRAIEKLLGDRRGVVLTGADVTPSALGEGMARVRFAHLATHGFFAEEELGNDRRRGAQARDRWNFQPDRTLDTAGAPVRSPLLYTGLVLSKANQRDRAGEAVLSGEAIVGLSLEGLRLCVLSACETGLGELTGGEGVQGLQRAFHQAGCPNVIASLWTVNDAATAALMAKFYHELWTNKKPPIEALREAQLTIYRRPDLIPDLAGERGAPRLRDAVTVKALAPRTPGAIAPGSTKHADTKLWAAFVLSGLGK